MNKDGTYRTYHLERKGSTDTLWCRPSGWDDKQDTKDIRILPVNVVGEWDFREEEAYIYNHQYREIKDSFNYVCSVI